MTRRLLLLFAVCSIGCGSDSLSSPQTSTAAQGKQTAAPLDACALIPDAELATIVGNALAKGEHFAGSEVCKWDAEAGNTTILLTVRPSGSLREQTLCPELKTSTEGQRLAGLADVAIWKFSNTMGLFNSGDLETCGNKGYVSLSLNGKRDEATLKQQSVVILKGVLQKL